MTGQYFRPVFLQAVRYQAEQRLLEVELHAGEVYQYFDVPVAVYDEMMKADSREQYFDRYIRLKYRHRRLIKI